MKVLLPAIPAALALALGGGGGWARAADGGPSERVARWLSPEFRRGEERLVEVARELEDLPVLRPRPFASRYGFRSETLLERDEPQWLQIDLGRRREIDRIVAMPVHIPELGTSGRGYGFPLRFKIEVADDPAMKEAVTVVDRTAGDVPNPGRYPLDFRVGPTTGRFVRFTSTRHFAIDGGFIWALEELLILSGNRSVASERESSASGSLELYPNWALHRIKDGQSALGLPVMAEESPSRGYLSALTNNPEEPKWLRIDLGREYPIDEIRLVPVESGNFEALGVRAFPRGWRVELASDPGFADVVWSERMPKSNLVGYPGGCAVVIPVPARNGRYLRFVAEHLWGVGHDCGYGLAEIQAYAGDENVALGKPVAASDEAPNAAGWAPAFVTDGFGSLHRLIELPESLDLIGRRGALERERDLLLSRREHLAGSVGTLLSYGGGGLGAVAVLGCGWLLVRQRTLRQRAVTELRDQIARDLHDDIGSNLGGIVLLSEIGGRHSADERTRADFSAIKEAADEASTSMRDIVWLIQRGNTGLRDLVTKMRQVTQAILGDKEISLTVDPPGFRDRNLSLLFRRHVFFAFKETLNNVRRHALASSVEVSITIEPRHLSFTVRDDGVGFDLQGAVEPAHGLGNMMRRAARLHGNCHLDTRPGQGTRVTFKAPLKSQSR